MNPDKQSSIPRFPTGLLALALVLTAAATVWLAWKVCDANRFAAELNQQWNARLRSGEIDVRLSILATGIVLAALLVVWFTAMRTLTRWRAAFQRAHDNLEMRVQEHTAELRKASLEAQASEACKHASQQIIEGILNAIPVRVFWKDKNLVYLGCNAVFARDAGFADPKDIIGKDDSQMGWRDRAELYRSDDRQVIESGCSKLLIEKPQTTPEGHTLTLLTSKIPLRGSNGEISGILGMYMDITEHKWMEAARVQLIQELQAALANVKSLSGLLPICAGCKKIRDDTGYWSQVESYIQRHSEATFTHGLCPDCIKKYYPDLEKPGLQTR